MAATIFGIGEISPQPGFSAKQSEQGGWVASHEFAIRAADFDDLQSEFVKGTLLADLDPDIPYPFSTFLRITEVEFSRSEGDLIFLQVTATGSGVNQYEEDGLGTGAEPTYTLNAQLTDAPLSDHPKYVSLDLEERLALELLLSGEVVFNVSTGQICSVGENAILTPLPYTLGADAIEFATLIARGITTYLKTSITWQESTEGIDQLATEQLTNLGKIATPRGNPPTPVTRDWLLTTVSSSQQGELYRTNLEWTQSERGGWNQFLYED